MGPSDVAVSLDAVIVAVSEGRPRVLTVTDETGLARLPSGPLDVAGDPTLERGLRRWIAEETGIEVGYAEQLYTFGDLARVDRREAGRRWLSIAYLALVREAATAEGSRWEDVYRFLPWEDHREGRPTLVEETIRPALEAWAGDDPERRRRVAVTFGTGPEAPWDGVRALDRYELLYEVGLVAEAYRDRGAPVPDSTVGVPMAFDHRRILATALGRIRGKLTYRPVVFELLPERFTLTELQRTVEALAGVRLHTQNFRRLVERTGLVEGTGERTSETGGRPAELFRFRPEVVEERPRPGLGVPYR